MKRNYDDPQYEQFRKDVLKRDKYKCKMPGCKSKIKLQVHHIKKWSRASALRYDTNNGITLCRHCHKLITGKEHHYEKVFESIINGI
jgi:5-methylcytosine-specific restriction endonuclease McrA